jgi:hypothetical protein
VPISVTCPQCSTTLKVKDELAGKRGKCPKCEGPVQIPAASAAEMKPAGPTSVSPKSPKGIPLSAAERQAKILDPLSGQIEKLSAPFSFRLRMFLAATATCLLPAFYAVLVTLFLGGAVMWFLYAPSLVGGGAVLLYVPAVVLIVIGLALFKPLVAPRPSKGKTKSLARDKAPLLFELVDKLAAALNAELLSRSPSMAIPL